MKMKAKRFLSLILCVLLTLTLLPPLTARADGPAEQYTNLTPGTTYYFDLSNMNIPGESDWLPDKTLHWTPFTYAGTINAYYSDSFGIRQAGDVNITAHSLFVADAPVCRASFGSLDANGLMFNKTYTKNDINAVLRAPSGGSFVASGSTTPESNEYDQIINKNPAYYKDILTHDFLTQDSYFHPEDPGTTYVMCRGGLSGTRYDLTTSSANEYRPVIQLKDTDAEYVRACALDLDGLGTFGTKHDITQVSVVYNIGNPYFILPGFTPENGIDLYPGVDSSKLRWYINGEAYSPGDSCLPGKIMAAGCPFEAGYALGEEGLQLAKPQNLRWDAAAPHLAKWDVVPNAQTYDLQMYKNGVPLGSLITGISVASYNLASAITNECAEHGGGAFTFMVRAVGDGTDYTVGNYSSQSLQAPNVLYGISPVTVSPAHGSQSTIAGLGLPATVNLLTSRGSVAAAVTWDAGCIPAYDIHDVNGCTFYVNGTFSVPVDVLNPSSISSVVATVNVKPALSPGDVYYFDMTGQFPRLSVYVRRYSSFLYVGDINAYSLASEDDTPDNAAAYDHRLFLGSCNGPSLNGYSSWNTYNDFGLIFGKPYTSGGVNYKIRAMSAGDGVTKNPDEYGAIMGTGYFNNPTDPIYSFPNIAHIGSWAQEAIEGGRAYMSYGNREHVAAEEYKTRVLMPVLEVPAEIDAADFKTVVCNGKKILYTGERATLPTIDPDTDDTVEAWRTTDGSVHYPAGAMVTLPSGTALTSVASYDFGTENQLTEGETYYFDLSAQSIPHCEGVATLKWTPFVYAGSITAYSKSDATATYPAPGDPFYSSSAGGNELDFPELNEYYWYITYGQYPEFPGTPANGLIKKEATSPRTLFVAPTLAHALWRELNLQNLIFGKPYTSNNAAYTLRTLSGGSYGLDPRYLERENITEVYRKVVPSTNEISVLLQKGTDEGSPYKYLQTIRAGGAFTLPERYYEDFKSTMRYHVHYRIFEGGAIINTANPPQDNTGSVKFLPALQAHSKSLRSVTYNIPEGIGAVSAVEGAKHSLAVAYEGSVTLPEPTAGNGFALMPGVNSADLRWFDGTDYYQPGVTLSGLPTGAALTLRYAPGTAGDLETPENPVWDGANPHLAKWDAVENAENYDIQLYKNGVPLGSVISVPAAQTQYDFSAVTADEYAANGGGSYTFSVRARDGAAYTTSAYSTSGAAPNVLRGFAQISAVTTHGSPKTAAGLRLPSVTLSTDGGNVTAPVVWDMDAIPYNPANPDDRVGDKTYTVPGMITLPETVKNPIGIPLGLTAPVTVTALVPGDSYFFDMSGYSLPNPSWSKWIPFVYTGTINAYSLSSEQEAELVTAESPAATEHELFVAQRAVYGNCSWSNLNEQGLVFGKPYASGGINYNLRLMSVSGGYGLGGRKDDEWSRLCLKGFAIEMEMATWGQDTAASNPNHRLIGIIFSPNEVRSADKSAILYDRLYHPVLQLPELSHNAYKIITYDMTGKGSFRGVDRTSSVIYTGTETILPTIASGDIVYTGSTVGGDTFGWYDEYDSFYPGGASVSLPSGTTLTPGYGTTGAAFVAVTDITGVPTTATAGTDLPLSGTVAPADATNKTIAWSVKNAGATGATISGSTLSTTAAGTVTVTATITNGLTETTDYTQDFTITADAAPVTDAAISPDTGSFDKHAPADVTTTITWGNATGITDVKTGGISIGAGNYSVSADTFTIKKEYLAAQITGSLELIAEFNAGAAATLTIDITDTTPPFISPVSRNYDLIAPADVTTAITWNSAATVTNVVYGMIPDMNVYTLDTGDYSVPGSTLTILDSFLSGLSLSTGASLDFDIIFNTGATAALTVNVVNGYVPSDNADLSSLSANGTPVSGFDPDVTEYTVVLPYGASGATVAATADDVNAQVAITQAASLPGNATVTVTAEDGTLKAYTINFTIGAAPIVTVTNIAVTGTGGVSGIQVGSTLQMLADIVPANATDRNVTWSIEAGSGATISASGLLEAAAEGSVTVRATANDGSGVYGEITVTITAAPVTTYTVTFNSNGSVYAAKTVNAGASIGNADWPADPARSGYTFGGWFTGENGSGTQFTSAMPVNAAMTAYAKWTYNGDGNSGGGGDKDDDRSSNSLTPPTPAAPDYKANMKKGNGTETTLPVTVNKNAGTASIDVGSQNLAQGGNVTVTMPSVPGVTDFTAEMPVANLTTPNGGTLTFNTGTGSLTLPSDMLSGIPGAEGKEAEITIGVGDKSALPDDVKSVIGDRPLISLSLRLDGKQTDWNNPGAPVTVSIPYKPTAEELANPESIVVWYIDGAGNVVTIPNGHYDPATGTVTFQTTHFSDYAVTYNKASFKDVAAGSWYKKAVSFIAARGITAGTGSGNYSPEAKLKRGEFLVMLMKAYGISPDTNPADNFSDAGNMYYTGYLAAAKRLGISAGTGSNMYAPGKEITRQEMFTLLYNALKIIRQLPQGNSGKTLDHFTDAGQIASWAKDAMSVLVGTGTISGSDGVLNPTETTTRAEMAQVLYNLLRK